MTVASGEAAVGITCFANACAGFTGILKHRYADFKVNEVNLEGEVVQLTSLEFTKAESKAQQDVSSAGAGAPAGDAGSLVERVLERFAALAGSGQAEQLRGFLQQALLHQAGKQGGKRAAAPPPLMLEPITDKAQRTSVHRFFKALPGFSRLETDTVETAGGGAAGSQPALQCIQVRLAGQSVQGQKRKWRQESSWPVEAQGKRYVKFVLFKENMDAQQALANLAKMLHVNHKVFSVAGTKDKRGATVQQVTAFKLDPARLAKVNSQLHGMKIGNFEFVQQQLRLGDLQGNRFELVLRNIEAEADIVAAAIEGLKQSGFVNYFGLQRFGSGAVATHRLGQVLLQGKWKEAAELILRPHADARPEMQQAWKLYSEKGDIEGAMRLMPHYLVAEPAVLQGLKQHGPTNFVNALMLIPRNLRTMYIHAYQSYLWNTAASHRVQVHGTDGVVAGDLVLPRDDAQRAAARNQPRSSRAAAAAGGHSSGGTGQVEEAVAQGQPDTEAAAEEEQAAAAEVHVVTAEEAAAGAYSIEDVVLPLPGSQVQYPQHSTAEVYETLAQQEGISLHSSPHGVQEFSITALPGAYRHVLLRAGNLEYELLRYDSPDAELASTQLQALQGRPVANPTSASGRYQALRLGFTLPASAYATMLIRELTKQPTGKAYHQAMQHE